MSCAPNIFCWVVNFSAWPHLSKSACLLHQPSLPHPAAPRFAAGNPCCFGCGCLAAPLMPVPKLKQSLPLVPGLCCCLAEQTQLCVQPQSKQDQGMDSPDGREAPNSHTGLLPGAGRWQDRAAWRHSWFNPAEGGTAGCETTAHSSALTSDRKGLQPFRCWI